MASKYWEDWVLPSPGQKTEPICIALWPKIQYILALSLFGSANPRLREHCSLSFASQLHVDHCTGSTLRKPDYPGLPKKGKVVSQIAKQPRKWRATDQGQQVSCHQLWLFFALILDLALFSTKVQWHFCISNFTEPGRMVGCISLLKC